jgi:hypothetical protein
VAIARDTGVLVPRIVIAWCLALEHLTVLRDAVAVTLRNGVLAVDRLALGRSPCEVVTADFNIVVGKLAKLVIIHTEKLSLLGSTELKTGDFVDGESEDGADGKGVGGNGNDVGDLLVNGGRGASDGAAHDAVVDSVESDNVVGTKDAVEEETNHSSDTVLSEHIEGIINLDPELD